MSSITIGSLNCRGLSDDIKRRDFFHRYRKLYDILILIDTHCTKEKENQWNHEWGYKAHFSSHSSHSRGVSVLINNTFKYSVHKEISDQMGNYVILDMTIQEYRMTLVAIYGPNEDNPFFFFENIKRHILDLQNSSIIIAGDWNVVQDFQTDTINYKTNNNIKAQKKYQN